MFNSFPELKNATAMKRPRFRCNLLFGYFILSKSLARHASVYS